jgi:fatty acid desaturase
MNGLPRTDFLSREDYRGLRGGQFEVFGGVLAIYVVLALSFSSLVTVHDGSVDTGLRVGISALAFLAIGWCQFSLSLAAHEAFHDNFGNPQRNWLAGVLTVYPIALTFSYKQVHWDHHRFAGDPDRDPDYAGFCEFPKSKLGFLMRFVRNASGFPAIWQYFGPSSLSSRGIGLKITSGQLASLVAVQTTIAAFFWWQMGPISYLIFWIVPLITIAKLCSSTRLLCEHGSPDEPMVFRSITGRPWQVLTLGMFNFHLHAEHHMLPQIPAAGLLECFRRNQMSRSQENQASVNLYRHFEGGYLNLLAIWFRDLPWRARS